MDDYEFSNVSRINSPPRNSEHVTVQLDTEQEPATGTQSLPPCDSGSAAWRLLLSAFVFEALLWGFPLSFGVFQDYYSSLPQFKHNPYISVVGTTASGISYIAAPVIIPLIRRYAKYRRHMILFGWPLCLLGLGAGSFAHTLGALIFTQGIMYGVGFIIFYYPILSMVNEFWVARRGLAYGLLCSASGVSGAAMPIILRTMLQKYGYPTTLRATAIALFLLTAPLIPLLKPRLPPTTIESNHPLKTNWSFLRKPLFWIYSTSNFAMGLGYFFPSLYLPSYATSNNIPPTRGALLLTLMSTSQVFGQLTFGYLSDGPIKSLPLNTLPILSTLPAAIAVYVAWGFSHTFSTLVAFALIYGFFGAGYTATWGRIGTAIDSEPSAAFAAFALLNFGKGAGNVLAGPIGGAMLKRNLDGGGGEGGGGYGAQRYEVVILFTGSCMLVSAATIVLCYVDGAKVHKALRKTKLVLKTLC